MRGVSYHAYFYAPQARVDRLGFGTLPQALAEARRWRCPSFQNPALLLHGWTLVSVRQSPTRPVRLRPWPDDELPHQGRWKPRPGTSESLFHSSPQSMGEGVPQGWLGGAAPAWKVPETTGDAVAGSHERHGRLCIEVPRPGTNEFTGIL